MRQGSANPPEPARLHTTSRIVRGGEPGSLPAADVNAMVRWVRRLEIIVAKGFFIAHLHQEDARPSISAPRRNAGTHLQEKRDQYITVSHARKVFCSLAGPVVSLFRVDDIRAITVISSS
jgi:hypothetical protein